MTNTVLIVLYFGILVWWLDRTQRTVASKIQREIAHPLSKIEAHLSYLVGYVASLEKKENDALLRKDLHLPPSATDKEVDEKLEQQRRQLLEARVSRL
jgi:hypothetical protein